MQTYRRRVGFLGKGVHGRDLCLKRVVNQAMPFECCQAREGRRHYYDVKRLATAPADIRDHHVNNVRHARSDGVG